MIDTHSLPAALLVSLVTACGPSSVVDAPANTPADSASSMSGDKVTTLAILDHHLEAFGEGNMGEILADYTDDSVLVTPGGTIRGRAGLEALFTGLFAEFAKPGASFTLDKKRVNGELAYITWTAETADNVYEAATDTFVMQNGKIAAQTFAGKITAKEPREPTPAASASPAAAGATQSVLAHHLGAFGDRNLDAILADYGASSVFIGPMGEVVGADALSPVFAGFFTEFAKPGATFELRHATVEGDVAFIVWNAETADNVYEWATDTFIIRNGTIVYQTLAAKVVPKG